MVSGEASSSTDPSAFAPTVQYLVGALLRAKAAPSAPEAERIIQDTIRELGLGPGAPADVKEFVRICEGLKRRGGLTEFVATMTRVAAELYQARQAAKR